MILLGACSGEPSEVVIGVSNDAGDASAAADDKAGTVADDSAPVETTTTTGPASTTTTEPSQTTVLAAPATKLEILGPTMIGIGDWATIRPVNAPETDCDNKTLLAYVVDGVIVHRYDELGGFGGVRLFNGLKGQDAFVINCEESIERVLLQGSAVVPQSGWPELTDIRFYGEDAPDAIFDFGSDFGWRGDIFAAYGYSSAGDELFMFDAAEGTVEPVFARIGERSQVSNVHGIDVVVPTGWVLEDEASVSHPESFSRVQVTRLDGTRDDPLVEGDEFLSSDSVDIRLWSTPDAAGTHVALRE
jgi:hypothetical protein